MLNPIPHKDSGGKKRPLILIHCALADSSIWTKNIKGLAQSYRIIEYDLRGRGQSPGFEKNREILSQHATDLRNLIISLSLERPILVGLSMDGIIAQEYLRQHDSGATAVIVSSPTDGIVPRIPGLRGLAIVITRFLFWITRGNLLTLIFRGMLGYLLEENRDIAKNALSKISTRAAMMDISSLIRFQRLSISKIKTARIACIVGSEDARRVHKHATWLSNQTGDPIFTIPESRHLPNLERPREFNTVLIEVLGNFA